MYTKNKSARRRRRRAERKEAVEAITLTPRPLTFVREPGPPATRWTELGHLIESMDAELRRRDEACEDTEHALADLGRLRRMYDHIQQIYGFDPCNPSFRDLTEQIILRHPVRDAWPLWRFIPHGPSLPHRELPSTPAGLPGYLRDIGVLDAIRHREPYNYRAG